MLIHRRMAPAPLLDKVVVSLDMAGIVAGCKFRGEAREFFRPHHIFSFFFFFFLFLFSIYFFFLFVGVT